MEYFINESQSFRVFGLRELCTYTLVANSNHQSCEYRGSLVYPGAKRVHLDYIVGVVVDLHNDSDKQCAYDSSVLLLLANSSFTSTSEIKRLVKELDKRRCLGIVIVVATVIFIFAHCKSIPVTRSDNDKVGEPN